MATMTEPIPGKLSDKMSFRPRYGNYIGGKWVEPASGQYFENVTPITGKTFCEIPRSNAQDIERALDAAHAARESWGHTSPTHRAILMNKIAQRMEDNLDLLALAETWDNGKPIRETVNADLPLAIDHWRYFAGCIRAQEGTISEIDRDHSIPGNASMRRRENDTSDNVRGSTIALTSRGHSAVRAVRTRSGTAHL